MARDFRIFPSIGIARLGDSPSGCYIGSEEPDLGFVPSGNMHRDAAGSNGRIKRMAARFRVYEFVDDVPVREVTEEEPDIDYIEWEVHLANTKATKPSLNAGVARGDLAIDTCPVRISGKKKSKAMNGELGVTVPKTRIRLGDLKSDDAGRLLVLGGHGKAATWNNAPVRHIQNDGWYDDTSDGPVRARVKVANEENAEEAISAWIIVGPPDFAHGMECIVTLYDLAHDLAGPFLFRPNGADVSFTEDIYPVLRRTVYLQWTNSTARQWHGSGFPGNFLDSARFAKMHDQQLPRAASARQDVFDQLRNPDDRRGPGNMPKLAGNLTLTPTQYRCFERWAAGHFVDDWDVSWDPAAPPTMELAIIPIQEQPVALTRAALEACVGGSFQPGIEVGDTAAQPDTYEQPFRISRIIRPGDLTHNLGVPWQADFNMCNATWWPSARPVSVLDANTVGATLIWDRGVGDNKDMVTKWRKLGFIVRDSAAANLVRYVESERTL